MRRHLLAVVGRWLGRTGGRLLAFCMVWLGRVFS